MCPTLWAARYGAAARVFTPLPAPASTRYSASRRRKTLSVVFLGGPGNAEPAIRLARVGFKPSQNERSLAPVRASPHECRSGRVVDGGPRRARRFRRVTFLLRPPDPRRWSAAVYRLPTGRRGAARGARTAGAGRSRYPWRVQDHRRVAIEAGRLARRHVLDERHIRRASGPIRAVHGA